eukprot:4840-Prymnesium_polylepis.1
MPYVVCGVARVESPTVSSLVTKSVSAPEPSVAPADARRTRGRGAAHVRAAASTFMVPIRLTFMQRSKSDSPCPDITAPRWNTEHASAPANSD